MANKETKISDAEWQVMRVIWTNQVITSHEIVTTMLHTTKWKAPTIKTLIGRLVKKNLVSAEKKGNRFIYRPIATETETIKKASNDLFANICSKKVGSTIANWIEEAELSFRDLDQIRAALEKKQSVAVEEVPCHCEPGQCECNHEEKENKK